ncbi:serine/threonine protein kinase [Rhodopirellula sp. P2]|uniref:serine/threonine protein kinase n=1 Tax=Rhodopirellula sp. P2 TaxID=2127060 RepID=UPI002368620A|nr:protein kinase [Rhodopirellula sp. P2]WDQ17513.1 protein kinase [Rhodopirellula sp. P2]
MTVKTTHTIAPGYEPITGYRLEKKIGEGGFGEVWRANAPGGLKKAVKFVFGAKDAKRGSRELKSLERIKGVHHPFLLTLERFGIVNDRLVIVTELADGSLEDVLKRHQDRGSCGIPRAALLSYLHDAADALDYLHGSYQLQHLDVKPGNLLLVGGHVKVGDFGLLKDLREIDHSVIGGLTPIYAPPELFDGRPSINSDQYSLAVMYQELLTGTRPFAGRTIAQLATQHIHAAPVLDSLPAADRVAVARALEKDPERRFESCKDFVEALRTPRGREGTVVQTTTKASVLTRQEAVEDLPSLQSRCAIFHGRVTGHALVVAVGGAGAECLHELRSRVATLHSACPLDLHSVLIDTDMSAIHAARLAEASDRIPPATILHTPLKSAQQYREGRTDHFRSLSRRWIYNVPRSGATEGMRPLGRLAMVDHAKSIDTGLRASIDHLAAVCGDRVPSVYIVGSLSGGTASGMVMDLAPRIRTLLDEAGLESASVLPLLSTVSLQGNPHQPLTLHDSHAAVSEIGHYMLPENSYPGDSGIQWQGVPASRNPLRNAYVVVDGDHALPDSCSAAATIVDYLWVDATGAGELLAEARRSDQADAGLLSKPMLRSVGVSRLKCVRALEENLLAPTTARHLLLRWLGNPNESRQIAGLTAERLRKRCGLDVASYLDEAKSPFGQDSDAITSHLSELISRIPVPELLEGTKVTRLLKETLSECDVLHRLDRRAATQMVMLRREISVRMHDGRIDVTSSVQATEGLMKWCNDAVKELGQFGLDLRRQQDEERRKGSSQQDLEMEIESAEKLAMMELDVIASELAAEQLKAFTQRMKTLHETLTKMAIRIAQAIRCIPGDNRDTENPWEEMPQEIQMRFNPVLEDLHSQTASIWLLGPLRDAKVEWDEQAMAADLVAKCLPVIENVIDSHRHSSENLTDTSTSAAAALTHESEMTNTQTIPVSRDANTAQLAKTGVFETQTFERKPGGNSLWTEQTTIESALQVASPPLLHCGGRQRLLLLVGSESERERLEPKVSAAHTGSLTTVVIPGVTPILVHEAQQIPIDNVLEQLDLVSGGNTQVSKRLHARTDVDWKD